MAVLIAFFGKQRTIGITVEQPDAVLFLVEIDSFGNEDPRFGKTLMIRLDTARFKGICSPEGSVFEKILKQPDRTIVTELALVSQISVRVAAFPITKTTPLIILLIQLMLTESCYNGKKLKNECKSQC